MSGKAAEVGYQANGNITVGYSGAAAVGLSVVGRTVGAGTVSGIAVTDALSLVGPSGASFAANAARMVPVASIVRAAAPILACATNLPCAGIAAAAGIGFWLSHNGRLRSRLDTGNSGIMLEGLYRDAGQSTVSSAGYSCLVSGHPTFTGSTVTAACDAAVDEFLTSRNNSGAQYAPFVRNGTMTCSVGTSGTCGQNYRDQAPFYYSMTLSFGATTLSTCPVYTDGSGASVAAGAAVGGDGKCPTGVFAAVTEEQAVAAINPTALMAADLMSMQAMYQQWLQSGYPTPNAAAAPVTITGPSVLNAPQSSTTTTDATGTITELLNTQWAPQYGQITADPSGAAVIGFQKTTTTTKTTQPAGGGAASTVTTVKVDPAVSAVAPGAQAAADVAKAVTQCDKFPNSVGCTAMGDVPTDMVSKINRTLNYAAEAVTGLPESCPGDVVMAGRTVKYQSICEAATQMRPWVLIGAAVSALLLVLAAIRAL